MYDTEETKSRNEFDRFELFKIYRAKAANTVAALTDQLFVTIPQLDSDNPDDPRGIHSHGPCAGWDRRSDGSYPQKGNTVTVFIDDTGEYWVANWTNV